MGQTLKVAIVGDASSYSRALHSASGATTSFGSSLLKLGKYATLGLGAAGAAGAVVVLKRGFQELADAQQKSAQTAAVLKSTGNAAHTSAKQVESMATSLSNLSGADDQTVQAGENMLLTFTNIRNQTGKNNDVFNQATKTLTDFAFAMNRGAAPSAEQLSKNAILLGKALNDPVKGITALKRVGVTFTEDQKKQIDALVKSGKAMDAQKLILRELNKEFGGSAAAAGKTLPGQLNIAKNSFDNLSASIAAKLLPTINQVLTWVNSHWPQISAVFNTVADSVGVAIGAVVTAIKAIIPVVQTIVAWFQDNWPRISQIAIDTFNRIAPVVIATFNTIKAIILGAVTTIQFIWENFGKQITAVTVAVFGYIKTTIQNVMNVIRGIVNVIGGLLHGDWARVWLGLQQVFSGFVGQITGAIKLFGTVLVAALQAAGKGMLLAISGPVNAIVGIVRNAIGTAGAAAKAVGAAIVNGIKAGLAGIAGAVKGGLDGIWGAISHVAGLAYNAAKAIGSEIVHGIVDGIVGLAESIGSAIYGGAKGGLSKAGHLLGIHSPSTVSRDMIGKPLAEGIIDGFASVMSTRGSEFAKPVVAAILGIKKSVITTLGPSLTVALAESLGKGIKDAAPAAVKGLNHVGQLIVAAAKKYGVDARAALAVAMGEGGVKFGAVGDSGHAFGPFQFNNAGGVATGKSAAEASAWANSAKGVADAIRMMAEAGAKGKTGLDAITAIIRNFERPLDPSASIAKAAAAYKTLGPQVAAAITSGTGAVKTSVANQLTALAALVKQYGPQIGVEHVRGIIAGLVGKTPDIVAAAKAQMEKVVAAMAAAAAARTELKTAFQSLAQGALAAFDAVTDAWVPPAQKLLDKMQLEDQINSAVGAVAEAQARIDAAVNTRNTLTRTEGESDADFAARIAQADADIKSATEQLGAAQRSYDELQLGLRAVAQKAGHDRQRAADREDLAADLLMLQTELAKHPEEYAKTQKKIIALMKTYHVPLFTAGQKLAQAFSDGLDDGIAAVAATARKLAAALEAIPGVGKTGGGGGGVNPNTYGPRGLGGNAGGSSSGRGTAAMNITVNMPNYLGDKREAAQAIRQELQRIGRDNAINPLAV
jgi:hypothetical protein